MFVDRPGRTYPRYKKMSKTKNPKTDGSDAELKRDNIAHTSELLLCSTPEELRVTSVTP